MAEKKEDPEFCGLDPIWVTGEKDPFWAACKIHDRHYTNHKRGLLKDTSSKKIDSQFFRNMGVIIQNSPKEIQKWLKLKRWVYYSFVRVVGAVRWRRIKGVDAKVD